MTIRTDLAPRGRNHVAVLAVDGGGIRGLIPARVLAALEHRAGMPACRLFDLVAGTSTGGIIALGLTRPGDAGKPRYAAADILELYRSRGPEIFRRSLGHAVLTLGGLVGPKYSGDALEHVLRDYFGATRLHEALTSVLVTSYDTAGATPYFFKSYRQASPAGSRGPDDHLMWQAARATAAAPTYFPPFRLAPTDPAGAERSLVDGGVFAMNPAMCALADAYKMVPGSNRGTLVVSLGTGNDDLRLPYDAVRRRGLLSWARPILEVVFDGVSDTVDYQAEEMAEAYHRFQEEAVVESMDDASPEAIERLLAAADALVARRDEELTRLAKLLRDNVSPGGPAAAPSA